jgi:uroporphyrin-III C-methyltransferase / precorrin-2 dehydrogenase / sirohydrochlorin ferrochelatase
MDYLPLFVDLRGRSCLLVGGGEVAARKLALLVRAGAAVEIVAPDLCDAVALQAAEHGLPVQRRPFTSSDVAYRYLVIAATDDADVNRRVFEAAGAVHTLVNSVDQPALSTVIFPAIVDRAPVLVAVSTGGASPTLARLVRSWIEARLPPRLGALASFIRERRGAIKSVLTDVPARQRFWQRLINGPIAEAVYVGDASGAERGYQALLAAPADAVEKRGLVALIGAGPGDPELLTLKGLRLLQEADVVLYDNLVNRRILDYARRDAEQVYVGKKRSFHGIRQEGINALLLEHALAGRNVVRLKGGDPFIFGRGGEEIATLAEHGIDCVVVPGITAGLGAASYAGIPLTHRDVSQSVRFVTGHRQDDRVNLDWPELARPDQTLVIYMGLPGLADILRELVAHGLPADTPAALVEKATLPEQRVIQGTVGDLAERAMAAAVTGPSTTIIGNVVALRGKGL